MLTHAARAKRRPLVIRINRGASNFKGAGVVRATGHARMVNFYCTMSMWPRASNWLENFAHV